MSYVAKILCNGEQVVFRGKLHWIIYKNAIFFVTAALMTMALIIGFIDRLDSDSFYASLFVPSILSFAAATFFMIAWFDQYITEIAVTDHRIIFKRGFISRHTLEMNIAQVESVTVDQSLLDRILDRGTIHIKGTGQGMEHFHNISSPLAFRSSITTILPHH